MSIALATPASQCPPPNGLDTEWPEVSTVRTLAQLMGAKAIDEARHGDTKASLQSIHDILKIGSVFEDASMSLIQYLTALTIKRIALDTLCILVPTTPFPNTELHLALQNLSHAHPKPENIKRSFMSERLIFEDAIKNARQMARHPKELFCQNCGFDKITTILLATQLRCVFKPNKTIRLHANYLRKNISLIGKSSVEVRDSFPDDSPRFPNFPIIENRIGNLLLTLETPTIEHTLQTSIRLDSAISATEAYLALRLYANHHDDALPATLDELVPHYLPHVPIDYADGHPIRYSQKLHALWSVGQNDLVVTQANQKRKGRELIINIPFGSTPTPAEPQ